MVETLKKMEVNIVIDVKNLQIIEMLVNSGGIEQCDAWLAHCE